MRKAAAACTARHFSSESSTRAFVEALVHPEPPTRVDSLLSQYGFCMRSQARQFCRANEVTLLVDDVPEGSVGEGGSGGAAVRPGGGSAASSATTRLPRLRGPPPTPASVFPLRAAAASAAAVASPGTATPLASAPGRRLVTGHSKVHPQLLRVNGAPLEYAGLPLHLVLHKPPGTVCTLADDEGPTVFDLLPEVALTRRPSCMPVGRLDAPASGLLVFTQSGKLAEALAAPRAGIEKEYLVALDRPLDSFRPAEAAMSPSLMSSLSSSSSSSSSSAAAAAAGGAEGVVAAFASGEMVLADGTLASPAEVIPHPRAGNVARVILRQGRHHQLRRMFALLGFGVTGIHRVRVGGLRLVVPPAKLVEAEGGGTRGEDERKKKEKDAKEEVAEKAARGGDDGIDGSEGGRDGRGRGRRRGRGDEVGASEEDGNKSDGGDGDGDTGDSGDAAAEKRGLFPRRNDRTAEQAARGGKGDTVVLREGEWALLTRDQLVSLLMPVGARGVGAGATPMR